MPSLDGGLRIMLPLFIAVIALALWRPGLFLWVGPRLPQLLGLAMFGVGATLRPADFARVLRRPLTVFAGSVAQYVVMPTLAWALSRLAGLPAELAMGVMLVGACPGGTFSNVMTFFARGNVALSMSMTMATTLLAPLVTPTLCWWLIGGWVDVSLADVIESGLIMVVVPVGAGMLVNRALGERTRQAALFPMMSACAIALVLGGTVAVSAGALAGTTPLALLVVVALNLLGYALGFLLAEMLDLRLGDAKALALEVGMQNSGLATYLALVHLGAVTAIPGALFSVSLTISGTLLARFLAGRTDANRPFLIPA